MTAAMAETVSTNQFRNGMHIELDGDVWRIVEFQHVKPGKGGAFVRTKLKALESGAVVDKTFRAGEAKFSHVQGQVRPVPVRRRFRGALHGRAVVRAVRASARGGRGRARVPRPVELVQMLAVDGKPAGIQLPSSVELTVAETEPAVRATRSRT